MNEILHTVFGSGKDLNVLQMSARSFIMFFITLMLIRISGVRSMGQKAPMDSIIVIMLGAVLGRAVVGASPFIATVAAGFVLAITHKIISIITEKNEVIGHSVKGDEILLYADGQ